VLLLRWAVRSAALGGRGPRGRRRCGGGEPLAALDPPQPPELGDALGAGRGATAQGGKGAADVVLTHPNLTGRGGRVELLAAADSWASRSCSMRSNAHLAGLASPSWAAAAGVGRLQSGELQDRRTRPRRATCVDARAVTYEELIRSCCQRRYVTMRKARAVSAWPPRRGPPACQGGGLNADLLRWSARGWPTIPMAWASARGNASRVDGHCGEESSTRFGGAASVAPPSQERSRPAGVTGRCTRGGQRPPAVGERRQADGFRARLMG
jgi:hypothetical protein